MAGEEGAEEVVEEGRARRRRWRRRREGGGGEGRSVEGAFRHGADVADGSHDEIVDDQGKDVEAQSRASLMHSFEIGCIFSTYKIWRGMDEYLSCSVRSAPLGRAVENE